MVQRQSQREGTGDSCLDNLFWIQEGADYFQLPSCVVGTGERCNQQLGQKGGEMCSVPPKPPTNYSYQSRGTPEFTAAKGQNKYTV